MKWIVDDCVRLQELRLGRHRRIEHATDLGDAVEMAQARPALTTAVPDAAHCVAALPS